MDKLLEINNMKTSFYTQAGEVMAVRGLSFNMNKGEALGIVGESGSGKSVTMMSLMRLLPDNGKIIEGNIIFEGRDLSKLSEKDMQWIRGNDIGMIFQDPMTSLNPVFTIGNQLMEPLIKHKSLNRSQARERAIHYLSLVGIPEPKERMKQYPHEFSGGMRQRVMIAMAICCNPKLLIADEPTTALDVTIQAQILELMVELKDKLNTSIILITHDLGVVAELCDSIKVMYGGLIVEEGFKRDIFYNARHPYTWGLLKSIPNPKNLIKKRLKPINGQPPDLLKPPKGCPFAPRCEYTMKVCMDLQPPLFDMSVEHRAACWLNHPDAPHIEMIKGKEE